MTNSKWQMNRVGLIDFWYYDQEEFYFMDGRMLLRGANGSGKSVTMQSFVPLLLDGNMRPERLDPFGSRARRMENYLLEEGDGREERTSYLYLELKRQEGENYLTVGIGLRARKNKKLDTWYFYINDGRRIGTDLNLYKDLNHKIAYSKQELKNRIGDGGRVFESQTEYMDYVNRLLFGFEKSEEYKELLDLLIQLRTPKLSKDFKPSVVNDILSNSLQMLSEDDLRPMSEAIENMDALRTNLITLEQSVNAAKQIKRVYQNYNQMVLYQKADYVIKAEKEKKNYEAGLKALEEQLNAAQQKLAAEKEHYQALQTEEEILKKERDSLSDNDAVKLKEQEVALLGQIEEEALQIQKKETQEREKGDKYREVSDKVKQQKEQNEINRDSINEQLEELEEALGETPFDEFAFMKSELLAEPEVDYNFDGHLHLLDNYTKKVEDGIEALYQEKRFQERVDEQEALVDQLTKKQEQKERETTQYKNQLQEISNELTEKIYSWSKANRQLNLSAAELQQISRLIEAFQGDSDYLDLKDIARFRRDQLHTEHDNRLRTAERELAEWVTQSDQKQLELKQWQDKKDPEPEISEEIRKNRALLKQKGIPFQQFYKNVDFDKSLKPEQASRLEEALLSMGILDALIIPAEYRGQVLALDKGVCDHYIFSDISRVKSNLLELLDVDNPDNNILHFQSIANILEGIGYTNHEGGASTWINEDGSYRLGILEGTITKEYETRYIGASARAAYRQKRIEELTAEWQELESHREAAGQKVNLLTGQMALLEAEWERFPSGDDLKIAAKEFDRAKDALEQIEQELKVKREQVMELEKELEKLKIQVRKTCELAYLAAKLDLFLQAKQGLKEYQQGLTQLQIGHHRYKNGLAILSGLIEQLEDLDGDLDEIRYELVRLKKIQREKEQQLISLQQQLELTDYDEIKERLETCILRLSLIPNEREKSVQTATTLENQISSGNNERLEYNQSLIQSAKRLKLFLAAFEAEYQLGYVERQFVITEDMIDQAKKVSQMLSGTFGTKKLSDLFGDVQTAYHQYRGYLLEYNLTMDSLFEDLDNDNSSQIPSMKRLEIMAKYRGIRVKFQELYEKLEKDMKEQENLLSDKDRELFEDILANTISKKIRVRIQESNIWVTKMNQLMESMETSSGLKLSLKWKNKRAEQEEQLDTSSLVKLLQKDAEIMREEEVESLSKHFRSKIEDARKLSDDGNGSQSFHAIIREVLDYRKWFEFQLEYQKTGESKRELTDRVFFTFSGGEKAMAMYVPLFSAVVAKYAGARSDAPRIISLDEAFAGVDEMNIKDMFRLMVNFEFNFMINSQILWGDYETVPALAIYQLIRPENARYVTVIPYIWNGKERVLIDPERSSPEE